MYRIVIVNVLRSFNVETFCSNYIHIDIYYLMELPARLGRAASAAHAYVRTSLDYIGLLLPGPAEWQHMMLIQNAPDQASCTHGSYWVE